MGGGCCLQRFVRRLHSQTSTRLHILDLTGSTPTCVAHVDRTCTGGCLHIHKIGRLLTVSHEVLHCLAMGGADAAATKNADRLRFRVTMPTFHKG
jgi:hypothetical protein